MSSKYKRSSFLHRNSLSITLLVMMLIFWVLQFYTGWKENNEERQEEGLSALSAIAYGTSGHFISATFENWESEFLQMCIYVLLTVRLRQWGSSESKKPDDEEGAGEEEVNRIPQPNPDAPWPVRKGGWWLKLYSNSLSIVFGLLFLLSFFLHFRGSLREQNDTLQQKGKPALTAIEYIQEPKFWFESFQNWQSEFLAVAAIVLLSIWLRQHGSPESKPVDASHRETGTS